MGERDQFVSMEMAAVGIETVTGFGRAAVEERLRGITAAIGEQAQALGNKVTLPDPRFRAPHLICLGFPGGMPADLVARLAAEKVYAAPRLGRLRLSPHVYNDGEDVARLVRALERSLD